MHIQLDLLCLFLYFSQDIFVAVAVTIRTGHFKVSSRSTKLKKCAFNYLHKKDRSDLLRVTEANGLCKNLHGYEAEESMTPGYNYAKLTSEFGVFRPPLMVSRDQHWRLVFPRVVTIGTEFSINFTWQKKYWNWVSFGLHGADFFVESQYLRVWVQRESVDVFGENHHSSKGVPFEDADPGMDSNITFSASENQSLEILIGGKKILTWEFQSVNVDQIRRLMVKSNSDEPVKSNSDEPVLINGFEFI